MSQYKSRPPIMPSPLYAHSENQLYLKKYLIHKLFLFCISVIYKKILPTLTPEHYKKVKFYTVLLEEFQIYKLRHLINYIIALESRSILYAEWAVWTMDPSY